MKKAVVKRQTEGAIKVREGRGYSLAKMKEASFDGFSAQQKGIPFDKFRRTKHDENVEQLRAILKEIKAE